MSRFWQGHARTIRADAFRGNDQYLWQPDHYPYEAIWQRLVMDGAECDRLRAMGEDGAFGCRVWDCNGYAVSRDLLDSLLEIRFLERNLPRFGIKGLLDIGAGYGRLAHRLGQTHPELGVLCTDAVEVSAECCRVYREHRRGAWGIVPPERVPWGLVDVAVNVHSWSECTRDEVAGWMGQLAENGVRYLFVVPHDAGFSTSAAYDAGVLPEQRDGTPPPENEFRSVIEAHGYRAVAQASPEFDGRHYFLFRRG